MSDKRIREMIVKQEIRDALSRYCRGLDRMDKEMADSVFHPEATALYYGIYEGTGHGFVDWVWDAHSTMQCHSHQITNVLTEVEEDTAVSEAYVTVVLWTNPDESGKQMEIIGRGRYLDRWAKRGGRWAIAHRVHVLDMQTLHELVKGPISDESARNESDPSFAFIKKFGG
jgi:hypothetical protein